jgi:hypothetical protein
MNGEGEMRMVIPPMSVQAQLTPSRSNLRKRAWRRQREKEGEGAGKRTFGW